MIESLDKEASRLGVTRQPIIKVWLAELADHIKLTRQENGCLAFNVTQSPDDPRRFNVYEEFQNTDAFEKHQARTKASTWALATANASRHYTITEE